MAAQQRLFLAASEVYLRDHFFVFFGLGVCSSRVVDTRADPGVRCGVELLLVGELCGFPVAQALGFDIPLAEYDRRKFAQAFSSMPSLRRAP